MDGFRAPDETRAQERGWAVVAAAYAEREPLPQRRRRLAPVVAATGAAALAAVAVTQPGRAVITSVRKAIGIEHARKALYALPSGGRILAGGWLVHGDGSTRRLGDYRETSWSPFGRYVVAAKANELVALTPGGEIRWTLARPDVGFPRWGGTQADTRIAYLSGDRLHVVAGDGTGDHEAGPSPAARVAPAWRPGGAPFTLAYADMRGRVWVFDTQTGRLRFRTSGGSRPTRLAWSRNGSTLLVVRPDEIDTYDISGRHAAHGRGRFVDAAFVGVRLAVLRPHELTLGTRMLFRTTGTLRQVVVSPDGRWLLVTWPQADEWLFIGTGGRPRVTAVANIA
ncbi:MAG: hypothetical protein ABUS54_11810 [Actinomycetota bacterium]